MAFTVETTRGEFRRKVLSVRWFKEMELVQFCRPLVETVNRYPSVTKDPSG